VCIALVVSRCGMPVGYELFAGNKADVTTVKEIVTTMEERYGAAQRIWVMDRGMVSAANVEFLKEGNRRYIMGTHKTLLRRYEKQLIAPDWNTVQEGLEVKLCADPDGGSETFILCRSAARRQKESVRLTNPTFRNAARRGRMRGWSIIILLQNWARSRPCHQHQLGIVGGLSSTSTARADWVWRRSAGSRRFPPPRFTVGARSWTRQSEPARPSRLVGSGRVSCA
jgi:hypothetical protein